MAGGPTTGDHKGNKSRSPTDVDELSVRLMPIGRPKGPHPALHHPRPYGYGLPSPQNTCPFGAAPPAMSS